METKKCERCGNQFARRENEKPGRWNRRTRCGRACAGFLPGYKQTPEHTENHAEAIRGRTASQEVKERMRASQSSKPLQPCKHCQNLFKAIGTHQKYCSRQCKYDDTPKKPFIDLGGYVQIWVGHNYPGNHQGRMKEHRYLMQEIMGRPLTPDETVHHLNGNRQDNRIENLEFRVGQHGKGATHHCPTCTCHLQEVA